MGWPTSLGCGSRCADKAGYPGRAVLDGLSRSFGCGEPRNFPHRVRDPLQGENFTRVAELLGGARQARRLGARPAGWIFDVAHRAFDDYRGASEGSATISPKWPKRRSRSPRARALYRLRGHARDARLPGGSSRSRSATTKPMASGALAQPSPALATQQDEDGSQRQAGGQDGQGQARPAGGCQQTSGWARAAGHGAIVRRR